MPTCTGPQSASLTQAASLTDCELFWNVHLPRLIAAHRQTPLRSLSGALRFQLSGDGGGTWTIRMHRGVLSDVEMNDDEVTATVRLSTRDFLGIVRGELNHQFAFFTGRIGVDGDLGLLLSLATFIPDLRARFPFDPRALRSST